MEKGTFNITLKDSDKIGFVSNFSTMFSAGIPILEVVDSLLEDAKGNVKKILETLKADLTEGKRIYTSFAKFPKIFDKVTVSVIRASEEAGTLDTTLKDLKENIRRDMEFRDKIRSAMIYPLFIFSIFGIVFIVVLFFVIPRISAVFSRLRVPLPLPTKILIFISDTLTHNWQIAVISIVGSIIFGIFLFKVKRNMFLQLIFSLPFISNIVKMIDLTKFSRSLYLLLVSGLPIDQSLDLVSDVVIRRDMRNVINASREMVLSGKTLTDGLKASKGKIPNIMIKLIEAGERTGSLDKSLSDVSEYFDYQVTNILKTTISLIEPVMLVIIGFVVGGMMLSIIAPVYGLIAQIGGR